MGPNILVPLYMMSINILKRNLKGFVLYGYETGMLIKINLSCRYETGMEKAPLHSLYLYLLLKIYIYICLYLYIWTFNVLVYFINLLYKFLESEFNVLACFMNLVFKFLDFGFVFKILILFSVIFVIMLLNFMRTLIQFVFYICDYPSPPPSCTYIKLNGYGGEYRGKKEVDMEVRKACPHTHHALSLSLPKRKETQPRSMSEFTNKFQWIGWGEKHVFNSDK